MRDTVVPPWSSKIFAAIHFASGAIPIAAPPAARPTITPIVAVPCPLMSAGVARMLTGGIEPAVRAAAPLGPTGRDAGGRRPCRASATTTPWPRWPSCHTAGAVASAMLGSTVSAGSQGGGESSRMRSTSGRAASSRMTLARRLDGEGVHDPEGDDVAHLPLPAPHREEQPQPLSGSGPRALAAPVSAAPGARAGCRPPRGRGRSCETSRIITRSFAPGASAASALRDVRVDLVGRRRHDARRGHEGEPRARARGPAREGSSPARRPVADCAATSGRAARGHPGEQQQRGGDGEEWLERAVGDRPSRGARLPAPTVQPKSATRSGSPARRMATSTGAGPAVLSCSPAAMKAPRGDLGHRRRAGAAREPQLDRRRRAGGAGRWVLAADDAVAVLPRAVGCDAQRDEQVAGGAAQRARRRRGRLELRAARGGARGHQSRGEQHRQPDADLAEDERRARATAPRRARRPSRAASGGCTTVAVSVPNAPVSSSRPSLTASVCP